MCRAVLVVQLRPGAHGTVTELLQKRPLIDLTASHLNSHQVFCSQEELVLVFEGSGAERAARAHARSRERPESLHRRATASDGGGLQLVLAAGPGGSELFRLAGAGRFGWRNDGVIAWFTSGERIA